MVVDSETMSEIRRCNLDVERTPHIHLNRLRIPLRGHTDATVMVGNGTVDDTCRSNVAVERSSCANLSSLLARIMP